MVLSPYRTMIMFSHVMMIIPRNDALKSCTNATSPTIPLSCNSTQWIHVRSETYGNATLKQGCLNTTNSCTVTRMNDTQGLIVNCNGEHTCYEYLQSPLSCTPVSGYEVIYDCVEESLNVCSSENKSTNGPIYLHSPSFPDSARVNASCTCRITGTLMSVQLIQNPYGKTYLNISTDGDNLEQGVVPVNRIIVQRANHTTLNYQGVEDGRFWIKVTGFGMITVTCSDVSNNMPSTPDTTKGSSSTGMGTVTFTNETSSTSSDTTSLETTTTGNSSESSDTGMGTVTFTNETSSTSSDTTSLETTTTGNSSETSDTVTDVNNHTTPDLNVTQSTDLATNDAAGPISIVALASIGAAGVFVVLALIVVGVICCRRLRMSKVQKRHIIADHNYFQLDPDFVSLDRKEAEEEASTPREECYNMPQYAKVSGSSRSPAYDNNTFNDGDHGMITNSICVSRPPNKEQPKEGMVDNFLYHTFRHSDTTAEATNQSPVVEHGIGDKDKGMVINDLNHGDQTSFVDQNINTIAPESHEIDPRCNSDGEETTDRHAVDGMMVNDLYHSYQASSGNQQGSGDIPAVSAQIEQPQNNKKPEDEEDTARMVINGLYHSYQSPQQSKTPNKDQELKDGAEESHNDNLMVENDLYYQERKPSQDDVTQRISAGHYEEIVNNELPDSGDVKDQGPKPRPPDYEDIADIASTR